MSDFNRFNRSHSESDIYVSQFDNLTVSSPNKNFTKLPHNSCSSIVRRIYIEEVFCSDGKQTGNMFRKCSLIDGMKYAPNERRQEQNDEEAVEEIPMEVDMSFSDEQFPKIMLTDELDPLPRFRKINVCELDKESDSNSIHINQLSEETNLRVIHINPVKKVFKLNLPVLVLITIICIACLLYFTNITIFIVNHEIQLENIRNDLKLNIHGHKNLIDKLIHILDKRANWSQKLQIISFIGSQGVGKTFFAEIVKSHFPNHLSHDLYGTHLLCTHQKQKIVDAINDCCLNLIVIDDLKQTDTVELFAFAHSLPKNAFILLIAILNTHYTGNDLNTFVNYSDIIKIRNDFIDSGIKNYELFVFEDFTYDQIETWIKKTLDSKSISTTTRGKILKNILSIHDVKHGLKGLNSKILLELEKHRT